jgi:hypothetical protein
MTDLIRVCEYCGEQPVAPQFDITCEACVYDCSGCGLVTPYESGAADDLPDYCDECWVKSHDEED